VKLYGEDARFVVVEPYLQLVHPSDSQWDFGTKTRMFPFWEHYSCFSPQKLLYLGDFANACYFSPQNR